MLLSLRPRHRGGIGPSLAPCRSETAEECAGEAASSIAGLSSSIVPGASIGRREEHHAKHHHVLWKLQQAGQLAGMVIKVGFQEVTDAGALRFAMFRRMRPDKA